MGAINWVFSFSGYIFNFNHSIPFFFFFPNFYLIWCNTVKYGYLLSGKWNFSLWRFCRSVQLSLLQLISQKVHFSSVFSCVFIVIMSGSLSLNVGIRDSRKDSCLLWQLPEGMLTWTCFRLNSGWRLFRPTRDMSLCQHLRGGQDEAMDSQRGVYSLGNGSSRQADFPSLPLLVGSCFFFILIQDIALGVPVTHRRECLLDAGMSEALSFISLPEP